MPLFLTCIAGRLQGQKYQVAPQKEIVIGRDPSADIILHEPVASRRHARVFLQGGQTILEDLGSTHGTWVNRRKIDRPTPISSTDLVSVGATELRIEGQLDVVPQEQTQPTWPFIAEGQNARLEVWPDRVKIVRYPGFSNLILHGIKGDKEIFLRSVSGLQYKPNTKWTVGYFQFTFGGGLEAKKGIAEAVADENTVSFLPNQEPAFVRAKEIIDKLITSAHGPQVSMGSPADELAKLADLHQRGILSADEFQKAKTRLGF